MLVFRSKTKDKKWKIDAGKLKKTFADYNNWTIESTILLSAFFCNAKRKIGKINASDQSVIFTFIP